MIEVDFEPGITGVTTPYYKSIRVKLFCKFCVILSRLSQLNVPDTFDVIVVLYLLLQTTPR